MNMMRPDETFPNPTRFTLLDTCEIPSRPWVYGRHLIRRNVSVTLAPGGVGKSSLSIVQALEIASGKRLLTNWNAGPARVWLFNLEDDRDELNRRVTAACSHHSITATDFGDRLYIDSGRESELLIAEQKRDELVLNKGLLRHLEETIIKNEIDVLTIDPLVSAHRVNEMDNGKMDVVAKSLVRLADKANCAIELIHHTRKLNGSEATSDASRGASSVVNAARSSRVLQRYSDDMLDKAGVKDREGTYFYVKRDKSNLAIEGGKESFRTVSVDLGQGDTVGVVERFEMPGLFDGINLNTLKAVQKEINVKEYRYSDQTGEEWVGYPIAKVTGLDVGKDRTRIKGLIKIWISNGALKKDYQKLATGKEVPMVIVGEWANH